MKPTNQPAKHYEDWMNRKWRPLMGYTYMITCITDFIIFPILWSILQAYLKKDAGPWVPLTLQGGGLFHLAMGAVLGVAAWSRGREKLTAANNYTPYPNNYTSYPGTSYPGHPTYDPDEAYRRPKNLKRRPIQEEMPEI